MKSIPKLKSKLKLSLPTLRFKRLQGFDWVVLVSILILAVAIGVILWRGEQTPFQVTHFSWEGKQIGVKDRYFTLSFNRPVDRKTVETNLVTNPPLPGKITWSGDKLVYTLTELPIYGNKYEVQLQNATPSYNKQAIEPFISVINTHDRAFVYIGIEGQERGRLILRNIIQSNQNTTELKKVILTPGDLVVTNFEIYPQGDKILFAAFDPSAGVEGINQQQLYTVTTGLNFLVSGDSEPVGRLERILDAKEYKNWQFDLSDNGQTLVVQRENHRNPGDAGLWVIPQEGKPRPLGLQANDFIVSPDGQTIAVSQDQGVAIIPLNPQAGSPQFFQGYEKIVGFSKDGKQKLLVKINPNFTRSLFLVNQEGKGQQLFQTNNPIIGCKFEPREEKTLYCLKTDLVEQAEGQYREEPFLSIVDLETGKDLPFLALPNYRDVQMSMSPDGVALLFDQLVTTPLGIQNNLVTEGGEGIADGRLWLLPLPEKVTEANLLKILPEELNPGFQPRWLP
ncbi:conserved hypothetical protein [Gloeothece citriformis PCC 7424]|uniref:SbsA Ig-like domain-containing protein n=1 Tax=Gloeothece citriformis (strain PCC 7424) TaxID=65393 RepID=B7KDQ4_GLOC7|nr:anti-sigma factor [Gloeothece citriformis]ACK70356.1 conserved hypothetical protein [Gloeothece citriformis PCC 7424]